MNVLVVDDSKAIRSKLKRYLEELGHRVVGEGASGREAVDLFSKLRPELVTLDIVMPDMDGLTALRQILAIDPGAKVIMVTSAAAVSNMMEAREIGAMHFLIKPFTQPKVAEVMEQIATAPRTEQKAPPSAAA